MAKKEETMSMVDTFSEFKELKNIDRTTMISVLEESFRNVLAKMFGTDENFDIIVNPDKGDFEIWRNREVVEDDKVEDTNLQISLSEAKKNRRRLRSGRRGYRRGILREIRSSRHIELAPNIGLENSGTPKRRDLQSVQR